MIAILYLFFYSFISFAISETAPYVRPRSFGASEALNVEAVGSDAPLYQPAMIGYSKDKNHILKGVDFPSMTLISNKSTQKKIKTFGEKDLVSSQALTELLKDANEGTPQYLRMSTVFSLSLGRAIFIASNDHKIDAWKRANGNLAVSYRTLGFFGSGIGWQDPHLRYGFGLFVGYQVREQFLGDLSVPEPLYGSRLYKGWYTNIGTFWELYPLFHPTLSLTIENPYIESFKDFDIKKNLIFNKNFNLGGRVSYDFSSDFIMSLMIEKKSINKKGPLHCGFEAKIGSSYPDDAFLLTQYGFSPEGNSYSLGINTGLILLSVGGENINFPDSRNKQKRFMLNFSINPI